LISKLQLARMAFLVWKYSGNFVSTFQQPVQQSSR